MGWWALTHLFTLAGENAAVGALLTRTHQVIQSSHGMGTTQRCVPARDTISDF